MSNYTIRPLNTGFVPTFPLQYHYHHSCAPYLGDIPNKAIALPVITYLIEGGDKLILVDTGMCETERANKYHHKGSWQEDGQDIESLLKEHGYTCDDVDIVIFTHLHWDHSASANKFKNARLIAHEREIDFMNDPIPLYYKSYENDAIGITSPCKNLKFEAVTGETEILPGIRTFDSFGHSPGHISIEVDCKDGRSYICAGDSIFVLRNLDPIPELHYDITPPGRFYNIVESWKSIENQKQRVNDERDRLLLCHDMGMLDRMKKTPVIGE